MISILGTCVSCGWVGMAKQELQLIPFPKNCFLHQRRTHRTKVNGVFGQQLNLLAARIPEEELEVAEPPDAEVSGPYAWADVRAGTPLALWYPVICPERLPIWFWVVLAQSANKKISYGRTDGSLCELVPQDQRPTVRWREVWDREDPTFHVEGIFLQPWQDVAGVRDACHYLMGSQGKHQDLSFYVENAHNKTMRALSIISVS